MVIPAPLGLTFAVEEMGQDRAFPAMVIREGVFTPGLGNPGGKRIRIRAEVLNTLAPSLAGKPVNLAHSHEAQDEVGVCQDPKMDMEAKGLRAKLLIQALRPKFAETMGFIEGRRQAGQVPNVSVEFEPPILYAPAPAGETAWDLDLVQAKALGGVAILPVGACSDRDGCGIGLTAAHFHVLGLQAGNDHKEQPKMGDHEDPAPGGAPCGCKGAGLKKQLEDAQAALKAKDTELADAKTRLEASAKVVKAFEDTHRSALTQALTAALPKGTDLKALGLSETPTLGELELALKTAKALGAGNVGLTAGGRRTAAGDRDSTTDETVAKAKETAMLALRAKHGLPEPKASKLPAKMQRNTDLLLAQAAEGPAQA